MTIELYLLHHNTFPGGQRNVAFCQADAFTKLPKYIETYCAAGETSDLKVEKIVVNGGELSKDHGIFEVEYYYNPSDTWDRVYFNTIAEACKWVLEVAVPQAGYTVNNIKEVQVYE